LNEVGCYDATNKGEYYAYSASTTVSGRTCQEWALNTPHIHTHHSLPSNFCRNPGLYKEDSPWCYTTDSRKRWELCEIPTCSAPTAEPPSSAPSTSAASIDFFALGIKEILDSFDVSELIISNPPGTVWTNFSFSAVLFGTRIALNFRLPRMPTTFGDFTELLADLGVYWLKMLAPVDETIDIGKVLFGLDSFDPSWDGRLCLPEFCFCEPFCDWFRRLDDGQDLEGDVTANAFEPTRHMTGSASARHMTGSASPRRQLQSTLRSRKLRAVTTQVKGRSMRARIDDIDGPGDENDLFEMTGLWWQLTPGGHKFPMERGSDGRAHVSGMTAEEYQHSVAEDIHHAGLPSPYPPSFLAQKPNSAATPSSPIHGLLPSSATNETRGRELFDLGGCGMRGCCVQACVNSPIRIWSRARVVITNTSAYFALTTNITLDSNFLDLPGQWPSWNEEWTARIDVNFQASTRSLCDLIPQVGDFIRNTCVGGGEECGCLPDIDLCLCIDVPLLCVEDVISCEMLAL